MSDDLLAKEKEFRRLNRDLQLRTRDVMKTVDSIIHAGENLFIDENRSLPNLVKTMCLESMVPRTDKQLRTASIKVPEASSAECTNDPEILKKNSNVGNKAIITLLKGKIDMLYKKLQVVQLEYNNKVILSFCHLMELLLFHCTMFALVVREHLKKLKCATVLMKSSWTCENKFLNCVYT